MDHPRNLPLRRGMGLVWLAARSAQTASESGSGNGKTASRPRSSEPAGQNRIKLNPVFRGMLRSNPESLPKEKL